MIQIAVIASEAKQSSLSSWLFWIASLSLSSSGHAPDPLARNDGKRHLFLFTGLRFSMKAAMPSERSSSAKVA